MVALGNSNAQIGWTLGISRQTAKNHVSVILRKLNVDNRTQAAVWYHRKPKETIWQRLRRWFE